MALNGWYNLFISVTCVAIAVACRTSETKDEPPPLAKPPGARADDADGRDVELGDEAGAILQRLGRSRFLIGYGADARTYGLKRPVDIVYQYLTRAGGDAWPDWNTEPHRGAFVDQYVAAAAQRGMIPMFTTYELAAQGDGTTTIIEDATYMRLFWDDMALLAQRLGAFDQPVIVHLEPDFWGYLQKLHGEAMPAQRAAVRIAAACVDLADDVGGMAQCLFRILKRGAPKALVGLHASAWAAYDAAGHPDPVATGRALQGLAKGAADLIVVETSDRDAGCFETPGADCDRGAGPHYWDETNQTSPNFREHLAWAKAVGAAAGVPLLWWQMPMGVPSDRPGGSPRHYRDNRVRYVFSHVEEFVAAGGVGACFGAGRGDQTDASTDGGQFERFIDAYFP